MNKEFQHIVYIIGFSAQLLFGLRVALQWIFSERRKQAVSPVAFWLLSLAGSLLFLIYGLMRKDWVIIGGQSISFYIYVKNLQLKNFWQMINPWWQKIMLSMPVLVSLFYLYSYPGSLSIFKNNIPVYLLITGFTGQFLMSTRFIYQVFRSVRTGESIFPVTFWLMSLAGTLLLLIYAYFRKDPVLILAQSLSIIPYSRNLYFAGKSSEKKVNEVIH